MMAEPDLAPTLLAREGRVVYTTFHNPDNGWSVLSVEVAGRAETWVGNAPAMAPGTEVRATGTEDRHERYGVQFKVASIFPRMPVSAEGIEMYLASGALPGIGPMLAKRIVARFGENAFDALGDPSRLQEVSGIGPKIASSVAGAWMNEREVAEVMAELARHGVAGVLAAKIARKYQGRALEVITREPYRLAVEVDGVGFATADRIARAVGISFDSQERARAGVIHALRKATMSHCFLPEGQLVEASLELLRSESDGFDPACISRESVHEALDVLEEQRAIVVEQDANGSCVYPVSHHEAERDVADRLRTLLLQGQRQALPGVEKAIATFEKESGVTLAPEQRAAVELAAASPVVVITGGPGSGKSTLAKAILAVFANSRVTVMLASPTGRAAKRLTETTGREAQTIHRLCAYNPREGWGYNLRNPLPTSAVLLDESSMADIFTMRSLLNAVPNGARFLFVGDVDQLPSVGPGAVLRDVIDSGVIPTVRLTRIFRQAAGSRISEAAHAVNRGARPVSEQWPSGEFFWKTAKKGSDAAAMVVDLVAREIPERFGFDPMKGEIQVLTPMRKGDAGAIELNKALAARLNPAGPSIQKGAHAFRLGDRVIQTKNDYNREVFNGDQGVITEVNMESGDMVVTIDDRPVQYTRKHADQLLPAYAITCHRFQGAEAPCVVVVMLREHYMLLSRNWIYTALSRGKRLVVLVADPSAMSTAVSETRREKRFTGLVTRLREGV